MKAKKNVDLYNISYNQHNSEKLFYNLQALGFGKISNEKADLDKNTKNKIILNKLDMVWLNVTSFCNYKCIHCYENASNKKELKFMALKEYACFFNKLSKKFKLNCVQITGGEPLSRGKTFIFSLINLLKKYNIKLIEVYTNLSLIDDEYIKFFKDNNIHIATSFYSEKEEIHESITQVKGSYQRSLQIIDKLKKNNISVRIGIVIMNQNKNDAKSLRTWLNKKFNLNEKKLFDVVRPMGRGISYDNVPIELFKEKFENTNGLKYYDYSNYYYNKIFNSCWGNKICLKNDGSLYPCVMSRYKLGNYKKVNRILISKHSYRFLNKDKIRECKICKYKYLCDECRPMNENIKRGLHKKPYTCLYDPQREIWRK